MNDKLVNIGKFKFDTTEWNMLTAQKKTIEDILAELQGKKTPPPLPPVLPSQVITANTPEANRPGMARDYAVTSMTTSNPDTAYFLDAYSKLIDPYRGNSLLFNNMMANGNIASISKYIDDHGNRRGGFDDSELEMLNRLLKNALDDFRVIISDFNDARGTNIQFPDMITINRIP